MKIYYSLKKLLAVTCAVLLINACASTGIDPLVGASWVAVQDITYPPRRTTVHIQDGMVLGRGERTDRFAPSCAIDARKGRDESLTIEKGTRFKITRVNHNTSAVHETMMIYTTSFQVEESNHPEVRTIQCSVWGGQGGRHVSTDEMQHGERGSCPGVGMFLVVGVPLSTGRQILKNY